MTDLYRQHGGAPVQLPPIAYDDDGQAWTDLANSEEGRGATGFVLAPLRPDDTETQTAEWDAEAEAWTMVDRPPAPPEPEPQPVVLGKGEFLDLFLDPAGAGVLLTQVRAASDDARLSDFWWALNNFYTQIRRDHPSTQQGVAAMVALGHVTQGQADAIFANWPTA